jgi:preprotein translocase subunit SecE
MSRELKASSPFLFPLTFIKEVVSELKQVTWPTRQETIQSTVIVIVLSVAVGIYIGGLDYLFTQAFAFLLK